LRPLTLELIIDKKALSVDQRYPLPSVDRMVPLLRLFLNLTADFGAFVNRIHDFARLRTVSDHE
jgi:hypothetical protein